jgi:hypothetical protein
LDAEQRGIGWRRKGHDICYYSNTLERIDNPNHHHYTLTYKQTFQRESNVYLLAHSQPFTWTDHLRHMDALMTLRSHCVKRATLCHTLSGRKCDVLTITDYDLKEQGGTAESCNALHTTAHTATTATTATTAHTAHTAHTASSRTPSFSSSDHHHYNNSSGGGGRGEWLRTPFDTSSSLSSSSSSGAEAAVEEETKRRKVIVMTGRVHVSALSVLPTLLLHVWWKRDSWISFFNLVLFVHCLCTCFFRSFTCFCHFVSITLFLHTLFLPPCFCHLVSATLFLPSAWRNPRVLDHQRLS